MPQRPLARREPREERLHEVLRPRIGHARGADVAVALPAHTAEIQERVKPSIDLGHIEAFENGTAGWATGIGSVSF